MLGEGGRKKVVEGCGSRLGGSEEMVKVYEMEEV